MGYWTYCSPGIPIFELPAGERHLAAPRQIFIAQTGRDILISEIDRAASDVSSADRLVPWNQEQRLSQPIYLCQRCENFM